MTRKKFIKQLMSIGYPRNAARALAGHVNNARMPYDEGLIIAVIGEMMAGGKRAELKRHQEATV